MGLLILGLLSGSNLAQIPRKQANESNFLILTS